MTQVNLLRFLPRWKPILRIGGIVAACVGLLCLPLGFGVSPKRDLSAFSRIADTGAFVKIGLALIFGGLLAVFVSRYAPGDME